MQSLAWISDGASSPAHAYVFPWKPSTSISMCKWLAGGCFAHWSTCSIYPLVLSKGKRQKESVSSMYTHNNEKYVLILPSSETTMTQKSSTCCSSMVNDGLLWWLFFSSEVAVVRWMKLLESNRRVHCLTTDPAHLHLCSYAQIWNHCCPCPSHCNDRHGEALSPQAVTVSQDI